jgi:hypothetical protein
MIQRDRPGHRRVQRGDLAGHRQLDQEIAALASQPGQAGALGADHQRKRQIEVGAIVLLGSLVVLDPDDPHAGLLQLGDRLGQVADHDDAQVLGRARGGVDDGGRDLGGAAAGQHHPVRADDLGGAQQRADVLRVLQVVEQQQQRRLAALDLVAVLKTRE